MQGATMSKARKPVHVSRTMRTVTLSPRSEALLAMLSNLTGIPRGRIIDLALDCLEACPDCQGSGVVSGPMGPETETCTTCHGTKIVPTNVAPKSLRDSR